MRTLHGQFAPPIVPSQTDLLSFNNITMAAVIAADQNAQNNPQATDNHQSPTPGQAPSQQTLNVLVNTLLAPPQPVTDHAPSLDSVQVSQNASRPSSANGATPTPDQPQANPHQPPSPTAQQQMSIQSLLAAAHKPPNGQEDQPAVWNVNDTTSVRTIEPTPANGQVCPALSFPVIFGVIARADLACLNT